MKVLKVILKVISCSPSKSFSWLGVLTSLQLFFWTGQIPRIAINGGLEFTIISVLLLLDNKT